MMRLVALRELSLLRKEVSFTYSELIFCSVSKPDRLQWISFIKLF